MEFDIKCVVQKAMKGQALADLLASHPRWSEKKEDEEDEVTHAMTISWNLM